MTDRYERNAAVIDRLIAAGAYPAVRRVLKEGGSGESPAVQRDIVRYMNELRGRAERPVASPVIADLLEQVMSKAWDQLAPYREDIARVADEAIEATGKAIAARDAEKHRAEEITKEYQTFQAEQSRLLAEARREIANLKQALESQKSLCREKIREMQEHSKLVERLHEETEQRLVAQIDSIRSMHLSFEKTADRRERELQERLDKCQEQLLAATKRGG